MRLKRLELAGFKSFAKPTKLEFSGAISAVVGPNGSGKSNIAEGLRWVLGEQSLKTLRGKKGEDLIFNGSQTAPKLGKASVTLSFENKDKFFPVDYEEIIVTRKVFRDGANEYLLNGSKVRLKDIIEILGKVGLGTSYHHIISQGEADRILNASPKERRQMMEDSLGLKIYQLKMAETDRKLARTEENINQVEALQKEIQPHLKFLRNQAEKYEKTSQFRGQLKELYCQYFESEGSYLEDRSQEIKKSQSEPKEKLHKLQKDLENANSKLAKEKSRSEDDKKLQTLENEISKLGEQSSDLEREVGRYEGMIESYKLQGRGGDEEMVSKNTIKLFLERIKKYISGGEYEKAGDEIDRFSKDIEIKEERKESDNLKEIEEKHKESKKRLGQTKEKESSLTIKYRSLKSQVREEEKTYRDLEREIFKMEREINTLRDSLRDFEIDEEKLRLHKEEFENEREEAKRIIGDISFKIDAGGSERFSQQHRDRLKKDITRLKIKLEDSGGVSEEVLTEYNEVNKRDQFFTNELSDLKEASGSLSKIMKDLSEKLDHDFKAGIDKINKELTELFSLMFGGGKAELKVINLRKVEDEGEGGEGIMEEEKPQIEEKGIDISVSLPKKRINSMSMLSGGERALTSIALLFAMSRVNPPPFLVLDETDAALDESNSTKYGKMLKELSDNIQLIVITHNRRTMKEADILYGVTMGSDSVSKLLSVKFEEATVKTI